MSKANKLDISRARKNNDRKIAPAKFKGTEKVPITAEVNNKRALKILANQSTGQQPGRQARALVKQLGSTQQKNRGGWKVTAGIHSGGLGGSAGPADQRQHITLSTGHHIRLGNDGKVIEITGGKPEDAHPIPKSKGRQHAEKKNAAPTKTNQAISDLKTKHGLNDKQAVKAQQLRTKGGKTEKAAVSQAKNAKKSRR